MGKQDRLVDLLRHHERRHAHVDLRRLPNGAPLALEAERGKRPVVGAAARDPGAEKVGMCQQISGHKGAIAVATHPDPGWIDHTHFGRFIDGGFGRGHNLRDIGVVHRLGIAHHGHGGVVQNRVTAQQEEQMRHAANGGEAIGGAGHLAGGFRIVILTRISPYDGRQARARLIAGRQIQREGERHAIRARISD